MDIANIEIGMRVATVGLIAADSDAGVVHSVRDDGVIVVGWDSGAVTPCDAATVWPEDEADPIFPEQCDHCQLVGCDHGSLCGTHKTKRGGR